MWFFLIRNSLDDILLSRLLYELNLFECFFENSLVKDLRFEKLAIFAY